jgi:hypothetical protein
VQQIELELAVGDVVTIGEHRLAVVELDGDQVLFQLCDADADDFHFDASSYEYRPR